MFTGPQDIAIKLPRSVKAAALGVSLVLSALLTALALCSPDLHWLAWISFLPLFVVVRSLGCPVPARGRGRNRTVPHFCAARSEIPIHREWGTDSSAKRRVPRSSRSEGWGTDGSAKRPRLVNPPPTHREGRAPAAMLAGGFWGGCLYLFCSAGSTPAVDTMAPAIGLSAWLLPLLIVIPAVYVSLAARRTWAVGYKLLTLALGWSLIEATFHLHSLYATHAGLHTGFVGDGAHPHWFARLVGYVCTAFLVACVNASLVGVLSGVRLSFPALRSLAGSANLVGRLASQVVLAIQSWTLRQAYPRAPPIPLTIPS